MAEHRPDVVVVGGGLAGASAAAVLAAKGRRVILLERERAAHDKVCGEFISPEAQGYLADLGLDLQALGAVPIERLRLVAGARQILVRLPFLGVSLSRRVLDEALLARAASCGVDVRRGRRVVALDPSGHVRLEDGETFGASSLFLATGKHDLRGERRPAGLQSDLVGFKQLFSLDPAQAAALGGCVELILFDGGYAGLQPIERGRANLCLVVRRERLAAAGQSWDGLLAALSVAVPHLGRRLAGSTPCMPRPLAVSAIPYGYVRWRGSDLWRLGDQAAVIPSFAGDGMSIALHSGLLAARMLQDGRSATAFQRRLARDVALRVWCATGLSQLLVRGATQRMLAGTAGLLPGLVRAVASMTRLPDASLIAAE